MLPASGAARRRELENRERARVAIYDAAMLVVNKGRLPDAVMPLHSTKDDCRTLAVVLGEHGAKYLPRGSHVETMAVETTTEAQRPYGRIYEQRATSVSVWPLGPMTIGEVLKTGLLNRNGELSMVVFEAMKAAMDGVCERVVRPWESAAVPGRPKL
jgi:hypothetical protein